jgi:RNA polymerase sigma-70 factor (ECF subfamily)
MQQTIEKEEAILEMLPWIKSIISRYVKDREAVSDLAQDTVWKLIKAFRQGKSISNLRSYAGTSARNTAFDYLTHKSALECVSLDTVASSWSEEDDSDVFIVGYEDVESDGVVLDTIGKMLGELSSDHRQVLMMFANGFSYEEIAQAQAVSVGTVRSRMHFARRNAKKILGALMEQCKAG